MRVIGNGRPPPPTSGSRSGEALADFKGEVARLTEAAIGLPSSVSAQATACCRAFSGCIELQRRTAIQIEKETQAAAQPLRQAVMFLPPSTAERAATSASDRAAVRSAMEANFLADSARALRDRIGDSNSAVATELGARAASALTAFDRSLDAARIRALLPTSLQGTGRPDAGALLLQDQQRRQLGAQLKRDPLAFFGLVDKLREIDVERAFSVLELVESELVDIAGDTAAGLIHKRHGRDRAGVATDVVGKAKSAIAALESMRAQRRAPELEGAEDWGARAHALFSNICGVDPRTWGSSAAAYMSKFGGGARGGPGARYAVDDASAWPFRLADRATAQLAPMQVK